MLKLASLLTMFKAWQLTKTRKCRAIVKIIFYISDSHDLTFERVVFLIYLRIRIILFLSRYLKISEEKKINK